MTPKPNYTSDIIFTGLILTLCGASAMLGYLIKNMGVCL